MAVKQAILAALKKGDVHDRAFRETVYRQVFAALERSVATNAELTADDVFRRREHVVAMIAEIENDFSAVDAQIANDVVLPPQSRAPAVAPSGGRRSYEADTDFMPSLSDYERLSPSLQPNDASIHPEAILMDRREMRQETRREARGAHKQKRKKNLLIRLIVWIIVLILLALGGWWVWGQAEKALRTGGASIEEIIGTGGDLTGEALLPGNVASEWIDIFVPTDASTVRAGSGAAAQISRDDEGAFLSAGAGGGQGSTPIIFEVGQGALERFVGETAVFSLRARAPEGETQISLTCDFGELGKCNRLRYVVGQTTAEYLFEVELVNRAPTKGGTISITPDIEGRGRMLDVYSIKMSAE